MVGASRAEPRSLGDGNEDGRKTKEMIPSITFVAEKKLSRRVAGAAFLTGNVVVFLVIWCKIMAAWGFQSESSSFLHHLGGWMDSDWEKEKSAGCWGCVRNGYLKSQLGHCARFFVSRQNSAPLPKRQLSSLSLSFINPMGLKHPLGSKWVSASWAHKWAEYPLKWIFLVTDRI